jgi:hypothetical protein
MTEYKTIEEISDKFKLEKEYLARLIRLNILDHKIDREGKYLIPDYAYPRLRLLSKDKEYRSEIIKKRRHFLYEYHPELTEYLRYHDIVDMFAWMIKIRFSPEDILKNRKYRIDELFQNLLKEINCDPTKIRHSLISGYPSKEKFRFHLVQGWYNEIAATFPFTQDFNISSSLNFNDGDPETELFPSWKIIKRYYSVYSYFTALVFTENKDLITTEHRKSSIYFNRHQLGKYAKVILKFPFNIYYKKGFKNESFLDNDKRAWKFKYAQCPRGEKSIYDLEREYRDDLKRLFAEEANDNDVFTILDVLYRFRVWSNYQGINTLTRLKQGGLLSFLERNLYTINFCIAGLTELVAISLLGEDEFADLFEEFYLEYIKENDLLYEKWFKIPLIMRYRIYTHQKIIRKTPKEFLPPNKDELSLI